MKKIILSFFLFIFIFLLGLFIIYYFPIKNITTLIFITIVIFISLLTTVIFKKVFQISWNPYMICIFFIVIYFLGYKLFYVEFHYWYFELIHGYPYSVGDPYA